MEPYRFQSDKRSYPCDFIQNPITQSETLPGPPLHYEMSRNNYEGSNKLPLISTVQSTVPVPQEVQSQGKPEGRSRHDLLIATLRKHRANKKGDSNESRRSRYAQNAKMPPGIDEFQCHRCKKSYLNLESLKVHMETHLPKPKFQCPECSHRSITSGDLENHLETHKGAILFPCYECDFETGNPNELTSHRKEFHLVGKSGEAPANNEGSTILAGQAPEDPQTKSLIFKGRRVTIPTAIPTEEGPKSPSELQKSALQLSVAWKTRFGGNAYKNKSPGVINGNLIEMNSKNRQNYKLLSPILAKSDNLSKKRRIFSCPYCGKICSCPRNLDVHIRIHLGVKPFQCNLCNYSSCQESNAKRHMELHRNGKKLMLCVICGYAASTNAGLSSHFKKAHQDDSELHKTPAASKAVPEIIDLEANEEWPKGRIIKPTSPIQSKNIAEEGKRTHDNTRGFPDPQVQKRMEGNLENSELMELENRGIESSSKPEVMTPEASPKQNFEMKSPLHYKCKFCKFTSKFRIGLNKHVAKTHTDSCSTGVKAHSEQVRASQLDEMEEVENIREISDLNHEQKLIVNVERDGVDEKESEVNNLAPAQQEPSERNTKGLICPLCQKKFSREYLLDFHMRTHSSFMEPKMSQIEEPPLLSVHENTVNKKESDGTLTFSIHNVRSLNSDENRAEPGLAPPTIVPLEHSTVSQGVSRQASPYGEESAENRKTHDRNSAISPCKQCDFRFCSQLSDKIRDHIHRTQFINGTNSTQLASKNPTLLPSSLSFPTPISSSNAINSLAPPQPIFTLKPGYASELKSTSSFPRSIPSVFQSHISHSSIFPNQPAVTNSAGAIPWRWTPRYVPQTSASPHQLKMQKLLANSTGLNRTYPPINFQPVSQRKSSSHFNFKRISGFAGTRALINSKYWTHPEPFVCPYCFRRFKTRQQLFQHMIDHTSEKPYEYDQYQKSSAVFSHSQPETYWVHQG